MMKNERNKNATHHKHQSIPPLDSDSWSHWSDSWCGVPFCNYMLDAVHANRKKSQVIQNSFARASKTKFITNKKKTIKEYIHLTQAKLNQFTLCSWCERDVHLHFYFFFIIIYFLIYKQLMPCHSFICMRINLFMNFQSAQLIRSPSNQAKHHHHHHHFDTKLHASGKQF